MSSKTFKLAIIGTGAIAHIHAKAIQSIENAVLLGAYNRTKQKADDFGKTWNCESYETIEELLKDDPDVICICTASGMHLSPALQCIQAGKHCLIEKPLEISSERCDQIIQEAKKHQVLIGVVFPSRFYPASQQIKKAVDENRLGKQVLGSAYVKWSRDPAYYASAPWRGTWELDGGGALMNQAIHSVDLLQWYMGPVESVQAITANRLHENIEVEDTVVAIVRFKSGAVGTIECTTAAYPGSLKRIEIHGTAGTIVLEDNELKTWQFRDSATSNKQVENRSTNDAVTGGAASAMDISFLGHQLQIMDFLNAISNKTSPLVDADEGKKSVEIIQAIYQSAKTGVEVFIKRG